MKAQPLLIVISAPSGAGKSSLCDLLLQEFPEIAYSVSCTTRQPRGQEEDGIDYYFISPEAFRKRIDEGEFLEWAEVHGNYYGTPAKPIEEVMKEGHSVIMDIDVEGARQVRQALSLLPENNPMRAGFVDIFVLPPSMEELRRRLIYRNEDTPEEIEKRLANATEEMDHAGEYRFRLVNDDFEQAYRNLRDMLIVRGKWYC